MTLAESMAVAAVAASALTLVAGAGSAPGSVRLVRESPPIVRSACKQAQQHTRLKVTCPNLIPATRYVTRVGLWGEMDYSPSLWAVTFNNGDNGPGYIHWIAGAGSALDVHHYLLRDSINEVKGLPRLIKRSRVTGYTVTTYEYPSYPAGGPNGSHTAAFVACRKTVIFASIHGQGHETAATAMAVDLARRSHC